MAPAHSESPPPADSPSRRTTSAPDRCRSGTKRDKAASRPAFKFVGCGARTHLASIELVASPIADPCVMRVLTALVGKETLDVDEAKEAAQPGAGRSQVA